MTRKRKKGYLDITIPNEVWWAHSILYLKQPVGTTVYNEVDRIVRQYPEHFPWETTYNNISEEVHKAYKLEAFGKDIDYLKMPMFDEGTNRGWEDEIKQQEESVKKVIYKEMTEKDFTDFMDMLTKREEDGRKEELRIMKIWNKHYSKYGLQYKK